MLEQRQIRLPEIKMAYQLFYLYLSMHRLQATSTHVVL